MDRLRDRRDLHLSTARTTITRRQLDFDAIRVDKSTQVTVDALSDWAAAARKCATAVGKKNFMITGEVTGGDYFGALYM